MNPDNCDDHGPESMNGGRSSYRLMYHIGHGGMGEVFEARRLIGGQEYRFACKSMRPDLKDAPDYRRFFMNEARLNLAVSWHHPNVVTVVDCIEDDDGQTHIIMELVEGCSAVQLLDAFGGLEPDVLRVIARDTLSALDHLHTHGHFHRDVCSSNVLVSRKGLALLSDLGLAKEIADRRISDVFRGKLAYASPEAVQLRPCDHRSDLFSCGAMLYELVTGALVYGEQTGRRERVENMVVWTPPELPDNAPDDLRALVRALLQFDPAARPQHARDALALLDIGENEEHAARMKLGEMADALYAREQRWREGRPRVRVKSVAAPDIDVLAKTDVALAMPRGSTTHGGEHRTRTNTRGGAYRSRRRWIRIDLIALGLLAFLVCLPLLTEPENARQALVREQRTIQDEAPPVDRVSDEADPERERKPPTPLIVEETPAPVPREIVTKTNPRKQPGPSRNLAIQKTEPEPSVITPRVANPWPIIHSQQSIPAEPDDPANPTVYYFDLPRSPMRGKREAERTQQVKPHRLGTTSGNSP